VVISTIYGVEEPEAPVCLEDGSAYLVEMSQRKRCVTHVSPSGKMRTIITFAGRPNGLALDGQGNVWVAVAGDAESSVTCCSPAGDILAVIRGSIEGPFLWPNDLAFGPNGLLYMTDSGIRVTDFIKGTTIRPDVRTAPYDGRVYEIDPNEAAVLRVMDRGIRFTNGIAFGGDDQMYVSGRDEIRRGRPALLHRVWRRRRRCFRQNWSIGRQRPRCWQQAHQYCFSTTRSGGARDRGHSVHATVYFYAVLRFSFALSCRVIR
jgi:hypothetical protein